MIPIIKDWDFFSIIGNFFRPSHPDNRELPVAPSFQFLIRRSLFAEEKMAFSGGKLSTPARPENIGVTAVRRPRPI